MDALVTSSAPPYVAGKRLPLTQTLQGGLRTASSIDQTAPGTSNAVTNYIWNGIAWVPASGAGKATYFACQPAYDYAAYATPTDMVGLVNPTGSGKVIRVTETNFLPRSTAATTTAPLWHLLKRSTLNTGGTLTNPTPMKYDSANADPVGIVNLYSAAPTPGTLAGAYRVTSSNTAAVASQPPPVIGSSRSILNAATLVTNQQYLTLRPGESLYWNFNGVALPAGFVAGWDFEWTEEDD